MRQMTQRPIDLTKGVAWIKEESNPILITVIYLCGVAAGSTLAIRSDAVRKAAGHVLELLAGSASPVSLFLLCALFSVLLCAVLYGAGLCLIGYPCIYAVPLVLGTLSGAFFLTWMNGCETLLLVKCAISLPCFSAAVCCILLLCGYAAEMNNVLLAGRGGRDRALEKQYAARFLVLSGIILIVNGLQTLLLILQRHLQ